MHEGKLIFAQIMDFLPRKTFDACVRKYGGDYKTTAFSCRDQFLAMAFAQLTLREGLRGIQETLSANSHCLYHMGFKCKTVSKSTLADANECRSWKIYAELALKLMAKARKLYQNDPFAVDLDAKVFAIDSTTIELCLSQSPWAEYLQEKAAVKLHVSLDLHGNIPDFIVISEAKQPDVEFLDGFPFHPGAYYVLDRGYFSFNRLSHIHSCNAFFIIRSLNHVRFEVLNYHSVDKNTGLRCDQKVKLTGEVGKTDYPERIRRIKFYDSVNENSLVFLTNNFSLPALTIAELYKQRWQVELFFKWIKQHLKIKRFYGNNENAVRTQLWIAIAVYCLLAIIKKELRADRELHEIQEILSASIFQKMPILQAFSKGISKLPQQENSNQLKLFQL